MRRRLIIVMASLALAPVALLAENPLSLIKYGNWCGIDYPKENENPEPVNEVDALCRKHDKVWKSGSYGESDSEMARDLADLLNSGKLEDKEEIAAAAIMATYFTYQQDYTALHDALVAGKVSSLVKAAIAKGEVSVTLPAGVTAEVLDAVAKEIGGPGGKIIEVSAEVVRFPGKVVTALGSGADKVQAEASRVWRRVKGWF